MGVLDDAIRQHIELKRQHGASEQELERKRDEALGPARREAPADSSEGDERDEDAPSGPFDAAASEAADVFFAGPEEGALSDPTFSEQETRIFSADDGPGEAIAEPGEDWLDPEPGREPRAEHFAFEPYEEAAEVDRFGDPLADGDIAERALDDEPEDVLEETPEFLQDAPEHDRLWFEQKPPRDFDFDDDK